ncbi:hypothetical protein, partial [Halorubrum sp. Atlit-26R]|uniref:hypothetical protein n=1 Tax=Halorubrum sp. Atlit-26R TaxID=2282128 RepID=UPI001F240E03
MDAGILHPGFGWASGGGLSFLRSGYLSIYFVDFQNILVNNLSSQATTVSSLISYDDADADCEERATQGPMTQYFSG